MRKLTRRDIVENSAYEKERAGFRSQIIALKRLRRVSVGPVVTLVFENRDTIRFQIQEMSRVENLSSDAEIENELRAYNPLIPEPGHLSATLFIELTTEAELREWLPRLVGIERSVSLLLGAGEEVVHCLPDPEHEAQLSRQDVTAAVHYIGFELSEKQIAAFAEGPVSLAVQHPGYRYRTELGDQTRASLLEDLR